MIRAASPERALILVALLALSAGARADEQRWALLIGWDGSSDAAGHTFERAVDDLDAVRDALVAHAGFPASQVVVLALGADDEVNALRSVRWELARLAEHVDEDDLVYLHVALPMLWNRELGQSYVYARPDDPLGWSLPVGEVTAFVEHLAAPKRLVVWDAWRDHGCEGTRGTPPSELVPSGPSSPSRDAFTEVYVACGPNEDASARGSDGRGVFSVALCDALSGAFAGGDARTTLLEFARAVRSRTDDLAREVGWPQTPEVRDPPPGVRDYVLAGPFDTGDDEAGSGSDSVAAPVSPTVIAFDPLPPVLGSTPDELARWTSLLRELYVDGGGALGHRRSELMQQVAALDPIDAIPACLNAVRGLDMADARDVRSAYSLIVDWQEHVAHTPAFFIDGDLSRMSELDVTKRLMAIRNWVTWWRESRKAGQDRVVLDEYRAKVEAKRAARDDQDG